MEQQDTKIENKENFLSSQRFFNLFLKAHKTRAGRRFKIIKAAEMVNYSIFIYLFLLTFLFKASVIATVLGFVGGFIALLLHEVKHEGVLKESHEDMIKFMTREKLQYFIQTYIHTNQDHIANIKDPDIYLSLFQSHKSQSIVFSQKFYSFLDSYFNKRTLKTQFFWGRWLSKKQKQALLQEYEFDKILVGNIEVPNAYAENIKPPHYHIFQNSELFERPEILDNTPHKIHKPERQRGNKSHENTNPSAALDISQNLDNLDTTNPKPKYLYHK